jgi:hypothetical protein
MAEPKLTHYIFVRRDLPLGVLAAMVTHAAGESGALYADENDGRFRNASAVVLEAKNEKHLEKIGKHIWELGLDRVEIVENSGPYAGQFMAIGVVPCARDARLNDYQLLKSCVDNQVGGGSSLMNPNENQNPTQATGGLADLRNQVRMALNSHEDQSASKR